MFSNLLSNIDGIYIYPVISLLILLPAFIVIVIWAIKADKKYISEMEQLPLEKTFEENFTENKL
jgi:hypothetical protein